ncbi:hypothetical protein [Neobacillus mesonae]|uniref:hypothetical protein n=1 Tax=Neobacillus mesonae TaxID=1193713 RepID=UPI00203C86A3|nr:hypothetical protein [Neobacillus mesonae]MCM3567983.1 hypothetical protein [Neobacillus mesonae]
MSKVEEKDIQNQSTTNNNKNDVKVSNQFSFTFNFGDSLNLVALIAGIYLIKNLKKRRNRKKIKAVD